MITMTQFLMGRIKYDDLSLELQDNANNTVDRANQLLTIFGSPRACNSGYRSLQDQLRINPKALKSKHIECLAIDLEDKDGKLNKFCKDNPDLLESLNIWCEERQGGWQHIQIVQFGSYKPGHSRFFIP